MTDDSIPEVEQRPRFWVGDRDFPSEAEAEEYRYTLQCERRIQAYIEALPEDARPKTTKGVRALTNRVLGFLMWEWRERRAKPSYVEHADERLPVAHIAGAE